MSVTSSPLAPARRPDLASLPDAFLPEIGYHVYRRCMPTWHIVEDTIDFLDLTYVVKGEADYFVDGETVTVTAGDLLCLPPGTRREAVSPAHNLMTCYSVNVILRDAHGRPLDLPWPRVSPIGVHGDLVGMFRDLWHAWVHKTPGHLAKAHGLLLLIMHRVLELAGTDQERAAIDPRVEAASRYMSEHLSEPITVRTLADQVGLTPVYFSALFRGQVGLSPRQYLTRIRMHQAEEMLRSGECSIRDVAERTGYTDDLYFRRHFKAFTGHRPSEVARRPAPGPARPPTARGSQAP